MLSNKVSYIFGLQIKKIILIFSNYLAGMAKIYIGLFLKFNGLWVMCEWIFSALVQVIAL